MQLDVKERLTLSLMPWHTIEGNIITFGLVREFREALSFTENEIKLYKFKQIGSQVTWDNNQWQLKDFEVGEKVMEIVSGFLKDLNEREKLTEGHVTLWVKFIGIDKKETKGKDEKKKRNRK
ncbi:hypothetical protein LCGC14_1436210 [marine sediment metagenome]|uniref:Uncharacterized protein n=1 Tax=marine sediment metagenome TaxID=412755 RepID=A0A0F9K8B1_9ZZZZ